MIEKNSFCQNRMSDYYQGGPVSGRHTHIQNYEDAHERFNFLIGPDSRYYAYIPPSGEQQRPPQPKDKNDWLVVFVAAHNGNGPLTVVGWYENASFEPEYKERPEYKTGIDFETDVDGYSYIYCVSAD